MTVYTKNQILVVIAIALLTVPWTGEVVAVSQFLKDASFSIVDPGLFLSSSTVSPMTKDTVSPTTKDTVSPTTKGTVTPMTKSKVTPMTKSKVTPMTKSKVTPMIWPTPMIKGTVSPMTKGKVTPMIWPTPKPSPSPSPTPSPRPSSTPSPMSPYLQNFNPLSGFNRPVLIRGDDSLDTTTGIFHVDADGAYVFVIHRPGVDVDNPDLTLTVIPIAHPTKNQTLVTLGDTGDGNVFTTHVVAELQRDDRVLIANPRHADVIGTEDNPFIFNAFLLYHTPISSSPKVRQSAFSVTVTGNTSIEGVAFSDYDPPAVNINDDFNIESGTFLISIKGLYIFHLSATFMAHTSDGQPAVAISVNDTERARVQADVDMMQRIENVGLTIALPMVKGDTVQLINVFENPNIDCFATFAGYLLA